MLLRLTEGFAPTTPLPSPELERLRADVVLASVAAEVSSTRSRRRRPAFGLDPRLRAADLRAQERELARGH